MRKLLLAFCAFATICSAGAQWKPAGDKIKTDWAEKVDPRNVLPEYPRPGMERAAEFERRVGIRYPSKRTGRADEFRWEYLGAVRRGILLVRRAKRSGGEE